MIEKRRSTMETAYEWGVRHNSCSSALEERKKYVSQSEWYKACTRGDWLFWQLKHADLNKSHIKIIKQLSIDFATRSVEKHALHCGVTDVERWAANWISGDDRSIESARSAWAAAGEAAGEARSAGAAAGAAMSAAWATKWEAAWAAAVAAAGAAMSAAELASSAGSKELKRQSDEIHNAIPEWPGDKFKNNLS